MHKNYSSYEYTFDSEVKYMIHTHYLFDICVVCIYLKGVWSLFCAFFCSFDIDNYKTNDKLNKTKLRFLKVTYPWSLLMTDALKITKSKHFDAIKGDTYDFFNRRTVANIRRTEHAVMDCPQCLRRFSDLSAISEIPSGEAGNRTPDLLLRKPRA